MQIRATAATDARLGRVLRARRELAAIAPGCARDSDRDQLATLDRVLASARIAGAADDAAALAAGAAALARARALRDRFAAGDLGAGDAMDDAYVAAATSYERAFAYHPTAAGAIAYVTAWHEADHRIEANRASARATAFLEGASGARLVPELVPQPVELSESNQRIVGDLHGGKPDPDAIGGIRWLPDGLLVGYVETARRRWRAGHEVAIELVEGDGLLPAGVIDPSLREHSNGIRPAPPLRDWERSPSGDGTRIAVASGRDVILRDVASWAVLARAALDRNIGAVSLDEHGDTAALLDDAGNVFLWRPGQAPRPLGPALSTRELVISAAGTRIAMLPPGPISLIVDPDKHEGPNYDLWLWNTRDARPRPVIVDPGGQVIAAAWDREDLDVSVAAGDGSRLVSFAPDGKPRWRAATTQDAANFVVPRPETRGAHLIATGGRPGIVRLWRASDGALVASLEATAPHGPEILFQEGPAPPSSWVIAAADGRVDGSPGADAMITWHAGTLVVPGFVGWDTYREDDLLAAILAGR